MKKILLFAEVDLNLIDGSSIWLASLAELLSNSDEIKVYVLLRKALTRQTVVSNIISRDNVKLIDAWENTGKCSSIGNSLAENNSVYLTPEIASEIILNYDEDLQFDAIIIRSFKLSLKLSKINKVRTKLWVYMTDPLRWIENDTKQDLIGIFYDCKYFLCQTEQAKRVFINKLGLCDDDKIKILPPMIQDFRMKSRELINRNNPKLGYSGKFSPHYKALEMLDAFKKIKKEVPNAEFHIVGDKFYNIPPVKNFEKNMKNALEKGNGIVWYGGVTRNETNEILSNVDMATSWRSEYFDDSVEMSTKIIEYASNGVPVLMSPSKIHKEIFGDDYPGFVTNQEDFVQIFKLILSKEDLYKDISLRLQKVAKNYTFRKVLISLLPLINDEEKGNSWNDQKTILFVGHDFKFLNHVINHYQSSRNYNVLIDKLDGHQIKDVSRSRMLLKKADVVFCEWALGNADWYSNNIKKDQKLIIRLHHQELKLNFLNRIKWKNVDKIIFICQNNMKIFLQMFPPLENKSVLIYNLIDCSYLNQPKLPGAEFNLGFIGMSPMRKAPHRAVEIFNHLKDIDERYVLFFKGKKPQEYPWLWSRVNEREYYNNLFNRIEQSSYKNSIVFDPHGDDIPDWFTKIGFLFSTSDHEGSHQAVAEAMASGTIPLIRNWDGADLIYPSKFVYKTTDEVIENILEFINPRKYQVEKDYVQIYAREHFHVSSILKKYDELLKNLLSDNL